MKPEIGIAGEKKLKFGGGAVPRYCRCGRSKAEIHPIGPNRPESLATGPRQDKWSRHQNHNHSKRK